MFKLAVESVLRHSRDENFAAKSYACLAKESANVNPSSTMEVCELDPREPRSVVELTLVVRLSSTEVLTPVPDGDLFNWRGGLAEGKVS